MRIAILSSLPWLDRHSYKKFLLVELAKKPWVRRSDVVLVYGGTKLSDYIKQARLTASVLLNASPSYRLFGPM